MGKPLRLLNLALGLVAVLIAAALAKAWVAPATFVSNPAAQRSSQELAAISFDRPARPPLAQFEVLLEKNPFKQPPPPRVAPDRPGSPPPPPQPLPTLVGTMLVDDARQAILSDKGKSNIYSIGQEVGGGVITEIKEDRIMLKRGDTTTEVLLKAAIEQGPPRPGPVQTPGLGPVQTPAQPASMPPPAVSAPAASVPRTPRVDQYERERLRQEKKAQKEELKLFRKQQRNK
jgi:hypothetical protein